MSIINKEKDIKKQATNKLSEKIKLFETCESLKENNVDDIVSDKDTETKSCDNDILTQDETARKLNQKLIESKKNKNRQFRYILLGIITLFLILRLFISPVGVVGESMSPTYKSGQIIFSVNSALVKQIKYNQVVVFKNELTRGSLFIKRVLGLPGDIIQIKDGSVYRNGEKVEEDYPLMENAGIYQEEMTLGENQYFVLGDNRNASTDSRFMGAIDKSDICYVIR